MIQTFKEKRKPSFTEKLNAGMSNARQVLEQYQQQAEANRMQQQQRAATGQYLKSLGIENTENLPMEFQKAILQEVAANERENIKGEYGLQKQYAKQEARFKNVEKLGLGDLFGGNEPQNADQFDSFNEAPDEIGPGREINVGNVKLPPPRSDREIPEGKILQAEAMGEHGIAQQMRAHNDKVIEEKKTNRKIFEEDRKYHSKYSEKAEEEAQGLRTSLPKKEASLNFARNAIETGDVSYFSLDKLADATGIDFFRTAKGAQLVTAGKENLLSNMSRVTGRAQNMWFEQRLNSMFPKIGQSKEANLTVQEMLEGEMALDQAYLKAFDEEVARDEQQYGYVRKDVSKRAHDRIKPLEKDIMQRTTYRMKEIEEQEKGLKNLKEEVGKNVPNGTPITLQMLGLYIDKFGEDKAIKVAEKNGYTVPTYEQWQRYASSGVNE